MKLLLRPSQFSSLIYQKSFVINFGRSLGHYPPFAAPQIFGNVFMFVCISLVIPCFHSTDSFSLNQQGMRFQGVCLSR